MGAGYSNRAGLPSAAGLSRRPAPIIERPCDGEGRFAIEGLAPGSYRVIASQPGSGEAVAREVEAGAEGLRLELWEGGRLLGSVRDRRTGAPVASFRVAVRPRGHGWRGMRSRTVVDPAGRYEVDGVAPGASWAMVAAPGYAPSEEVAVTAPPPGESAATADFDLVAGGRICGRVADRGALSPIAGAVVEAMDGAPPDASPLPVRASAVAGADGSFEITGVSDRPLSLYAFAPGHHARVLSGLQVPEGGSSGPFVIELAPVGDGEQPWVELVAIGAALSQRGDALAVMSVTPGGPAAEAGLGPGDELTSIDGRPVGALNFDAAVGLIGSTDDKPLSLGVLRVGGRPDKELLVVQRSRSGGPESDVSDVDVVCSTHAFAVGGSVSGLAPGSKVVLQDNGTDDREVTGSCSFAFASPVADGATYSVSVKSQPTNPWQNCVVAGGTGRITGTDVNTAAVTCAANRYSVSGSISGLSRSGLILSLNGEDLQIGQGSSTFAFAIRVSSGEQYRVTVKQQPVNLACTVTSGGAGLIGGADIMDVGVTCICSAVASVAASEYQCVDFDSGMPASWGATVSGGGSLSQSADRAYSPSYSLVMATPTSNKTAATIMWSDPGTSPVRSVSASALLAPVIAPAVTPPTYAALTLLCVKVGFNTTCLKYAVNAHIFSSSGVYTGVFVEWRYVGSFAVSGRCPLSVTNLATNVWNAVRLDVDVNTGGIGAQINGASAASSCTQTYPSPDTVASVTIGPSVDMYADVAPAWTGYVDDIVAIVRR
jgi:hypothetical protein